MQHFLKQCGWLMGTASVPAIVIMIVARRWTWGELGETYAISALFSLLIGFPAGYVLPRLMGRCNQWSSAGRIAAFASTLFGLATVGTTIGVKLLVLTGYVPPSALWVWMIRCYQWSLFLSFGVGVVSYGYHHLRAQIEESNEKLRAKELEEQRARRLATEARLASLESRIQPHFLFNALNSVSALIREDPVRAELLLERVSALLRFSLYEPQGGLNQGQNQGLVSLEQELKITRDYLEIESVRFGERLRYSIDCAPELNGVPVPPLAVQTLVENSVKYAITSRRGGGDVRVSAQMEPPALPDTGLVGEPAGAIIEVSDSGDGFDMAAIPAGHGLELLQSRLEAHFGGDARLNFHRTAGRMTVRLRLPLGVPA